MIFDETTREEAAHWFAVLRRGPMPIEERALFDAWRAEPNHQRALDSMHELWGETSAIKSLGVQFRRRRAPSRSVAAAAAAAVLVVAAGLGGVVLLAPPSASAHISTAVGEQQTRTLPDGSIVALNVVTSVDYRTRLSSRAVTLNGGEAAFFVKKNSAKPFLVQVGDYQVRAVGTAFNVRLRDDVVDVMVSSGVVQISITRGPQAGQELTSLAAGQKLELPARAQAADPPVAADITQVPIQSVAEWRLRTVDYEDASVATVVEDLNRFFDRPIVVTDPQLAQRRVTIRLQIEDRDQTLHTLSALLGVQVRPGANTDNLALVSVSPRGG